ncbi:hypothetical protein D3C86_2137380 [compost metagenome]
MKSFVILKQSLNRRIANRSSGKQNDLRAKAAMLIGDRFVDVRKWISLDHPVERETSRQIELHQLR